MLVTGDLARALNVPPGGGLLIQRVAAGSPGASFTLASLMGVIAGFAIAGGVLLLIGASRLAGFKGKVGRVLGSATAH